MFGWPVTPATVVMRPPRWVPRNRQRRPEYASGLISCAAEASADRKNIATIVSRPRFRIKNLRTRRDKFTRISRYRSVLRLPRKSCAVTRNQTRAAVEGQVLKPPLDEDENAALKFDNVNQVDEQPDQPCEQARKMHAKNIRNRGGTSDHRHVALVEIVKRSGLRLLLHPRANHFCRVGAALHGNLSDTGERFAIFIVRQRQIANHENIGKIWDCELWSDLNAAAAIGLPLRASCEYSAKLVCRYAAGPQNSLCA